MAFSRRLTPVVLKSADCVYKRVSSASSSVLIRLQHAAPCDELEDVDSVWCAEGGPAWSPNCSKLHFSGNFLYLMCFVHLATRETVPFWCDPGESHVWQTLRVVETSVLGARKVSVLRWNLTLGFTNHFSSVCPCLLEHGTAGLPHGQR